MADTGDGSSSAASGNAALLSLTSCVQTLAQSDFTYATCAMNSGLFQLYAPSLEEVEDGYVAPTLAPEVQILIGVQAATANSTLVFGECQLLCSRPTIFASSSCCDAVARLHACQLTTTATAASSDAAVACKQVIDQTFAFQQHQCSALSAENAGLIAAAAAVALLLGGVALFARVASRRRVGGGGGEASSSTQNKQFARDADTADAFYHEHHDHELVLQHPQQQQHTRPVRRQGLQEQRGLQSQHHQQHHHPQHQTDLEARFAAASPTRRQAFLAAYRQVSNLVWKNLLLRRRKPVAFAMEQLLPLLLVAALVLLANLDAIFGSSSYLEDTTTEANWPPSQSSSSSSSSSSASGPAETLVCMSLHSLSEVDLGAPNDTLRSFYTSGQSVLGLFFLVSYVKFVSSTTTAMVIEKENRIREVMKIMGLSDLSLLCSWVLTSAALSTPLSLLVAAVLKFGKVFPGEEYATLVFLFWTLSLAIVSFSYFVTPLFNKSRTAAIVSVLVWLLLFFPFFAVQPKTNATKYWAALCPPTAFALGIDHILRRAQLGMGFAYSIAAAQSPVDVPTATEMSWFLVLDSALLVGLGWYLEQVLPQQYGVRKPFNFFLTRAYWVGGASGVAASTGASGDADAGGDGASGGGGAGGRSGGARAGATGTAVTAATTGVGSPLQTSSSSSSPTTPMTPVRDHRSSVSTPIRDAHDSSLTPRDGGSYVRFTDAAEGGSVGGGNDAVSGKRLDEQHHPVDSVHVALDDNVEPVSAALLAQEARGTCLQLRGLRKVFKLEDGEENVAVEGLDVCMYSGQITALLGHNGAGKTTTISMLTGLIPPTSGDATLYGRSIKHDFDELRRIIGICPQHDVLLQDLTVEEHLQLFGTMKSVPPAQLAREVDKMVEDVGLTEARHMRAKNLSGGQKRKLSVGVAFIGDSKLVFLDEPTSGMDPYSRRFTWNLLQKNREERVIVLTTHFMDEADILGDRIAIVADGRLCCAGSSLFLKNRYGAGYNLTLIKGGAGCSVAAVGALLSQFVPGAKCLSDFGSEVVFQLPTASSSAFPAMLEALDAAMVRLQVVQYGISVTTLEEVFLRISRDRDDASALSAQSSQQPQPHQQQRTSLVQQQTLRSSVGLAIAAGEKGTPEPPPSPTSSSPTFWTQYTALTRKRFQIARRDKKTLLNSVCIPLLFLCVLAALPTIEVASFIPAYATTMPSEAQQLSCPAQNITASMLQGQNLTSCFAATGFGYCTLGVVDCDPQVCCNAANYNSPLYPCNTCVSSSSTPLLAAVAARSPCFSNTCMKRNDAKLQVTMNAFLVAVVVMLGFAFIPASIVAFVVREKNPLQDAKSLQLISGANVSAYWLSSWTHDLAVASLSVAAAVVVIPLSTRSLHGSSETVAVALLVVLHVLSSIPLAYLFSFRFTKHAVAQTSLLVFALSSGGLLSIFSFMCRVIDFRLSSSLTLSALDRNYLRWLFLLFPGYSLNNGIYEIAARRVSRRSLFGSGRWRPATVSFFGLFEGLGKPACVECWDRISSTCCVREVFDIDVGGAPLIYSALEAVVLTLLVFYVERRKVVWAKRSERTGERAVPPAADEDEDVALERRRVESTPPSGAESVFVRNLHQQYDKPRGKVALKNLSLAIPRGECFGYLGINGAGKSTTMKVLTGTLAPTDGFVMLGAHDMAYERDAARRLIGYCPQFDALHDLLTVTEQLSLYARLKGVREAQVRGVVDEMVAHVGLAQYRDKLTRGLSGGNKRKVSTAIALIGSPPIVFLDEPSTGVDPSSRRKMWDVIAAVCAQQGSSVVLTTHSMEECEALCTRVGIMVSGALKCLGSVEHLKQKFGHGFTVEVKLREPAADAVARVRAEILRALEGESGGGGGGGERRSSGGGGGSIAYSAGTRASIGNTAFNTVGSVTSETIANVCAALGDEGRAGRILSGEGNGWVVHHFFETSGSIPVDVLSAWWVSESRGEALQAFFRTQFAGSSLVEQQGEHFRFQVPKHALRPSAIFALLEDARLSLHVSEYGVSDTSLEHIFNNMAAQQEEERGAVRGMYATVDEPSRTQ